MAATARTLLTVTVLATALLSAARPLRAQSSLSTADVLLPPPRSDSPAPPPPPATTLGAPAPLSNSAPFPAPPPAPPVPPGPPDASNPIYQPNDPGPNGWGPYEGPSAPATFFALHEVDILKPHLKSALTNNVPFPDGRQAQVQPPTTQLGWTGAPLFEFGWTLPNSLGYFAANYRLITDQANQNAPGLDGTEYALRTRLTVNQFNFDYGIVPYAFMPRWDVSGRFGIGLADVFFDNRAQNAFLTQYASNNFLGAGPHIRADVRRHVGLLPGLDLFGRADLTVLVGQIHQNYVEADVNRDGSTTQASDFLRKTQTVPVFTLQSGISYRPPSFDRWRFTVGYQFEEWFFVGQIDGNVQRGQFYTNGVFLRGEANF
ncbi:MAG TPA: hypothetical protein VH643_24640 [Gemmataceae bacterium]|jgi:hypothetical protein